MDTENEKEPNPVLVNRLPQIMQELNLTEGQFRGMVFDAGYSSNVADRMLEGDTKFTTQTIFNLSKVMGLVSMSDLIDIAFE